jgi:hypothetical protein
MSRTEPDSLLPLYQNILTAEWLKFAQKQTGKKFRRGVYSVRVVIWLIILQRLNRGSSLVTAVQMLLQGAAAPLLDQCHRVHKGQISSRTGAYCQARQRLPKLLCRMVSQQILEQLMQVLGLDPGGARMFILDGSSLELEHCPQLVRLYPPAVNQFGRSHWPILRIVMAHELDTGLALPPCWGPMYGDEAVGEQQLAERLMDKLPAGSRIVGDRNFGVFSIAYAAHQRGLPMLLRLTEQRARKLCGTINEPGAYAVEWRASRADAKGRDLPAGASVKGRVIAARIGRGKSQEWLYLFSTLATAWPSEVELYRRRGDIETDLRALKRTVNLHHIDAKSQDMLEKELLIAMSAYNLVRAVMCMAARRHGIRPRDLSFAGVLSVVHCAWGNLVNAPTEQEHRRQFLRALNLAAQCRLPKRSKDRSFPRARWRRSAGFPFRKPEPI